MKISKLIFLVVVLFPLSLFSQVQLTGIVNNSLKPIEKCFIQ